MLKKRQKLYNIILNQMPTAIARMKQNGWNAAKWPFFANKADAIRTILRRGACRMDIAILHLDPPCSFLIEQHTGSLYKYQKHTARNQQHATKANCLVNAGITLFS